MPDVRERIRDSRPAREAVGTPDVDALLRRARRHRVATRAAGAAMVFAVVTAGLAAVQAARPSTTVHLDDGAEGSMTDRGDATGRSGSTETAASLDEAIDQLIAANRQAGPVPVADDPGEILVRRTYAVWLSTSVSRGGATHDLEVVWHESRSDHRGTTEIVREVLGQVDPTGDLAGLRRQAAPLFDRGLPENAQTLSGGDPRARAEQALQEAERDSRGSAEPAPDSTERPDQAHAFMRAADALRAGLQPRDRIGALEIFRRLDPSLVEYRGTVQDLLGRRGIAIAGRDANGWGATRWNVLIFDPETGDLLGEVSQFADDVQVDAPPVTGYTALDHELVITVDEQPAAVASASTPLGATSADADGTAPPASEGGVPGAAVRVPDRGPTRGKR